MELVLASRNKNKIKEMEALLGSLCREEIRILSLDDIGFTEEICEDGAGFEENAVIKASVPASLGYIGIADDSGLTVDCLGGRPGIYSARFAGEHANDAENNEKLLRELDGVPAGNRGGAYVCVIAIAAPEKAFPGSWNAELSEFAEKKTGKIIKAAVFKGSCAGELLDTYRGSGGFGYDPLFWLPGEGKTMAELTPERKNIISHRGEAARALATWLNRCN